MPDALTTQSGVESRSARWVPAAIASAFFALSRRTNSLNAAHSSALSRTVSGCQTPYPVIEVPVVIREAMISTVPNARRARGIAARVPGSLRLFRDFGLYLGQRRTQEHRLRVADDRHLELEHRRGELA